MRRCAAVVLCAAALLTAQLTTVAARAAQPAAAPQSATTPTNDNVGLFVGTAVRRGIFDAGYNATGNIQTIDADLLLAGYRPHPSIAPDYELSDFMALANDGIVILDMHSSASVLLLKKFPPTDHAGAADFFVSAKQAGLDDSMVDLRRLHTARITTGWAIVLTHKGVRKIFAGHHVSILFNMSCHGSAWTKDFGAQNTLSYTELCDQGFGVGWKALQMFMDRMLGKSGIKQRTSTEAGKLEGVDVSPNPLTPITLAPAVDPEFVYPADGSSVKPGAKTPVSVRFDTEVKPAKEPVTLSGDCGKQAKISDQKWSGSTYQFTLKVPTSVQDGDITLTIPKGEAVGDQPGWPSPLFGNRAKQRLAGNGAPPPGDYVWHLTCGQPRLNLTVSGSQGGMNVDGQLLGTAEEDVQCSGSGDQESVIIRGDASKTGAVSITINGVTGTHQVNGTEYSTAIVSAHVQGAYKDNFDPNYNMGEGGGTVTISDSGGSIDANLTGGGSLKISGSWTCPASDTAA